MPKVAKKHLWVAPCPSPVPADSQRRSGRITRRHGPGIEKASTPRKTLVWIDDYEPALTLYHTMFEHFGFRVLTASRGSAGLELVASHHVDAVIVDYEMPEMNGEAVATSIKRSQPDLPVIMFSGSSLIPSRVKNVVDAFCDKAGSREELLATIHRLVEQEHDRQPVPVFRSGHEQAQRTAV
jgi:DNA-binding NtrC family response regulator